MLVKGIAKISQPRIMSHATSIKTGAIVTKSGSSRMVSAQRLVADANKSEIKFFNILPM